jgi:hypothetical protein
MTTPTVAVAGERKRTLFTLIRLFNWRTVSGPKAEGSGPCTHVRSAAKLTCSSIEQCE